MILCVFPKVYEFLVKSGGRRKLFYTKKHNVVLLHVHNFHCISCIFGIQNNKIGKESTKLPKNFWASVLLLFIFEYSIISGAFFFCFLVYFLRKKTFSFPHLYYLTKYSEIVIESLHLLLYRLLPDVCLGKVYPKRPCLLNPLCSTTWFAWTEKLYVRCDAQFAAEVSSYHVTPTSFSGFQKNF